MCETLAKSGPMSLSRVAETLANGLAADPLFCDLLANLHLHLAVWGGHREIVIEGTWTSTTAVIALADASQHALGRSGAFDILLAAYSLAATMWQIAFPRSGSPTLMPRNRRPPYPEWNLNFATALTQLLAATYIGPIAGSQGAETDIVL